MSRHVTVVTLFEGRRAHEGDDHRWYPTRYIRTTPASSLIRRTRVTTILFGLHRSHISSLVRTRSRVLEISEPISDPSSPIDGKFLAAARNRRRISPVLSSTVSLVRRRTSIAVPRMVVIHFVRQQFPYLPSPQRHLLLLSRFHNSRLAPYSFRRFHTAPQHATPILCFTFFNYFVEPFGNNARRRR